MDSQPPSRFRKSRSELLPERGRLLSSARSGSLRPSATTETTGTGSSSPFHHIRFTQSMRANCGGDLAGAISQSFRPRGGHIMMPTDQIAHTYSIVARDPDTGQLGVAVQSHYFSVGSVVTWAEAGVGAVATQSLSAPASGTPGPQIIRAGQTPPATPPVLRP